MTVIVSICGVIATIYTFYFIITCFLGVIVHRHRDIPVAKPTKRIAAVIAARNEATVIGQLVESLMAQDYPRELFDVFVIPNNCDDDTEAVARAAGARILDVEGPIHTKGDVLRRVFARLTATGRYDAYCVFDADNLVDKGFFQATNDALAAGWQAAQGFRDSKNPYDNWISGGFTAFFWFMNRFYCESRFRMNQSCHLNGTGFMVSDAAIRKVGWNTRTLTEDLEFTALCAMHGIKVGWMSKARIYDEQTTSFRTSFFQRRRWASGSLQCMRRYVPKLLRVRSFMALDMTMLFTGNLMCIIGLVPAIGTALGLLPFFIDHPWRVLALVLLFAVYYLAFCAVGAVLYKWEGRLNRRAVPGIVCLPIFFASWMPCTLWACLTPAPKWRAVRHIRGVDKPDIEEQA